MERVLELALLRRFNPLISHLLNLLSQPSIGCFERRHALSCERHVLQLTDREGLAMRWRAECPAMHAPARPRCVDCSKIAAHEDMREGLNRLRQLAILVP